MTFRVETLHSRGAFVEDLARRLQADGTERLARTLVLLPSSRAGTSLTHALLEAGGKAALLTPPVLTPDSLVEDLRIRMPELDRPVVPDRMRSLVLAGDLAREDWLRDHPDAAPGHAEALVRLFDDLRRAGLDPADTTSVLDPFDELQARDAERTARAWALYRRRIPYDAVDRALTVIDAACGRGRWPGRPCERLVAAGFVDLDPASARLLRAAARAADEALLLLGDARGDDALAARFRATWRDPAAASHPQSPDRRILGLLADAEAEAPPHDDDRPLPERLADLPALRDPPTVIRAGDPESEARLICAEVCSALAADPRSRIGVAVRDRGLARRVVARLRDAGVDPDDTSGSPLDAEPEGLLVRILLRCALTAPAPGPLLELVTHPLVDFGRDRGVQRRRALRLEREILRGHVEAADLDGLRARAREKDRAAAARRPDAPPELGELVDDVARALAPLRNLDTAAPVDVAEFLAALAESWRRAAPGAPLDDEAAGDDRTVAARRRLRNLCDDLAAVAPLLPRRSLAEAAADLSLLLRREEILPRRDAALPVQVTGLLEARLEPFDLLILGGLGERDLPSPGTRSLLLGDRWRNGAGLSTWRDVLGQQAELFVRLLGNAPRILVTFPAERDGQPVLPSPFLVRLEMAGLPAVDEGALAPVIRAELPDLPATVAAQTAFLSEPLPARALAPTRRPAALSHSALKTWRACPYRWLLERGFGLREQDEVIERFGKRDQGEIVHACLALFLEPEGAGVQRLRAGDAGGAEDLLGRIAAEAFEVEAGRLPQRRLWESTFRRGIPLIIAQELERIRTWTPAAMETGFSFSLGRLAELLPADDRPEFLGGESDVLVEGRIDRIDVRHDGDGAAYHVTDYKTGQVPGGKAVDAGDDLQLALYTLAVRLGGVDAAPGRTPSVGASYVAVRPDAYERKPFYEPDPETLVHHAGIVLTTSLELLRGKSYPLAPEEPDARAPVVCRYCSVRDLCRREERHRQRGGAA